MIRTPHRRSAFTLIELLVAMALAVVILALGLAVSQSKAFDSYKVVGSADRLSQWLLTAKSKALRDKSPRGIRLILDGAGFVREVAYIEQPDAIPSNGPILNGGRLVFYYPATVTEVTASSTYNVNHDQVSATAAPMLPPGKTSPSTARGVYLAGLTNQQVLDFTALAQPGDMISVPELRTVLRLGNPATIAATAANSPDGATLQLNVTAESLPDLGKAVYTMHHSSTRDGNAHPNIPFTTSSGTLTFSTFGLVRKPRPLLGEPTQLLPTGMAVDLRTAPGLNFSLNPPPADPVNTTVRDILFAPSGEVIGAPDSLTCLLIRDVNLNAADPLGANFNDAGQMILVCIYNRTGSIATQPVNPPATLGGSADPYQFARDGQNTGL